MLTNKGKYGLKAMVYLAGLPKGTVARGHDIAVANAIPKKFLDAILTELRKAGFVHTRKGKLGGYALVHAPEEVIIGHVIRVLDGPLAPIPCASKSHYRPCDDCVLETCKVRHLMLDVRNAMANVLDNMTLQQMSVLGNPFI